MMHSVLTPSHAREETLGKIFVDALWRGVFNAMVDDEMFEALSKAVVGRIFVGKICEPGSMCCRTNAITSLAFSERHIATTTRLAPPCSMSTSTMAMQTRLFLALRRFSFDRELIAR